MSIHSSGQRPAGRARNAPWERIVTRRFDVAGRKPATDSFVYAGAREIGRITSAAWSSILKKNPALASVEASYAALGTRLEVEVWHQKEIEIERSLVAANVIARPFLGVARRRPR